VGGVFADITSLEAAPLGGDSDGDGVPDAEDQCPASELSPTVVIAGCDSGVENSLEDTGCTPADLIAEVAAQSQNHGEFVSGVSLLAADIVQTGMIGNSDAGQLIQCAGQAP